MSTRTSTLRTLFPAGLTVIILQILVISSTPVPSLYLLYADSPDILIYAILTEIGTFLAFISTFLFILFILITIQRMRHDPDAYQVKKKQLIAALVFGIIIIVLETLFFAAITTYYILDGLGIIPLAPEFTDILIYCLIGIMALLGIGYIVFFVTFSSCLRIYQKIHDLKLFINFTLVFGIFIGVFYIVYSSQFIVMLIPSTTPDFIANLLLTSLFLISVFSGIAGLFQIIIAAGYMVIGKRK